MGFHDPRKPGVGVKNTLIGMNKNNNKNRKEGRQAGREGGREGGQAGRRKIDEDHREIHEHHRNCEPQVRQIAKNSAPGCSHFFRPLTKELFPNDAAPGISAKLTATFSSW